MARWHKCNVCGLETHTLAEHILQEHFEMLGTSEEIEERFGVSHWTATKIRRLGGLLDKKYCPRCGRERSGMVAHLLEYHVPLLLCARHTLGLQHVDVSAMFFGSKISRCSITGVYMHMKQNPDYDPGVEIEELPKYAIPIKIEGGAIKVMKVGEVGFGHIFADRGLSWV